MSRVRRIGALVLTSAIMCAFVAAVPANAAEEETTITVPEAFIASASARGLDLNLFGNRLTIGSSNALIDSSPKAQAQGAGVALIAGTVADALATGVNVTDTPPQACVANLPLLGLLTVALACGEANATTADGMPKAAATGKIASVDVGGTLLNPILQAVGNLLDQTLGAVVDPLTQLLGGLLNPLLGTLNLNLQNTVQDLLDGLGQVTGLLSVRVGPAASQAITTTDKVNGTAIAQGAVIELLPGLSALGAPLLTITVGDARATVDVTRPSASTDDPTAAVATPAYQAALVKVDLGVPVLGNVTSIPVSLGAPITLFAGTILESTIALGGGSTGDGPNGSKFAIADGVSIHLLKGLNGGIGIALAHAEAAGGGRSAKLSVRQIAPPVTQPEVLARTGADGALLPMAGVALLLAALGVRRLVVTRRP
ncbi:MAG: hypothetical protein ACLGI2_10265 [Acidimicrobiia bacterium]